MVKDKFALLPKTGKFTHCSLFTSALPTKTWCPSKSLSHILLDKKRGIKKKMSKFDKSQSKIG